MSTKSLAIIEVGALTIFGLALILGAVTRPAGAGRDLMLSFGVTSVVTGGPRFLKVVLTPRARTVPSLVIHGKILILYIAVVLLIYSGLYAAPFVVQRYFFTSVMPDDGYVLHFPKDGIVQPHTWFGTQCSLLSDSAFNHTSLVSYQLVSDPLVDPDEFYLRIKADLVWDPGTEPYVGIFCPLALPPEKQYFDLSKFRQVHVKGRLRWDPPEQPEEVAVRLVIYSDTTCPVNAVVQKKGQSADYRFPYVDISSGTTLLNGPFTVISKPLDDVRCEQPANDIHVDLHSVYQVGITIVGRPAASNAKVQRTRTGFLEIAELQFAP